MWEVSERLGDFDVFHIHTWGSSALKWNEKGRMERKIEVWETRLGDVIWHLEWTFSLTEERGGSLWTFQGNNKLLEVMAGMLESSSLNVIMPLFFYLVKNMTRSDFFHPLWPVQKQCLVFHHICWKFLFLVTHLQGWSEVRVSYEL